MGSYPTLSPLPRQVGAVYFLWHFLSGHPGRALPAAFSPWSPDFPRQGLGPAAIARPSGAVQVPLSGTQVNDWKRERLIQNARDALDAGQLQQTDQSRAGLAIGNAVHTVLTPVTLESLHGQDGFLVIFATRRDGITKAV